MKALFDCRGLNLKPGETALFMAKGKVIITGRKAEAKANGNKPTKSR